MKKLIALVLSLIVLAAVPMFALADGYGDSSANLKDDLGDNEYIVTRTTLENATGTTANPTDSNTTFGLYDSGEADYGKVYMLESAGYKAVDNGNTGVKYTFGEKNYTLFNEPLEANSYYIYSFDYKNLPTDSSKTKEGGRFSLAPKVNTFSTGSDWKDYVPASDNKWSTHTQAFYSGSVTSFSAKINTEGCYTPTYIDNFTLSKATTFEFNSPNVVEVDTKGTGIMYSSLLGSYLAPLGTSVTLKLKTSAGEKITKVMHGETEIMPEKGVYKIDRLTDKVVVDFGFSKEAFEENDNVITEGNNIYVSFGDRFMNFIKDLGLMNSSVDLSLEDGSLVTSSVAVVNRGNKITIKYGGKVALEYTAKFLGDMDDNGEFSVTDIVDLNDKILKGSSSIAGDLDKNRKNSVTDAVLLRNLVLNPQSFNSVPEKFRVLAIGNSFSVDGMEHLYKVAKAYGYEEDDIILGNLYIGGCSLLTHWTNAADNIAAYTYYKNTANSWKSTNNQTLLYGLQDEDWDYISIQQVSNHSGKPSTFEPYLSKLIGYINENKTNPDAQLMWHSTWAYQQDSTHGGFADYDNSQETMYQAILDAGEYVLDNFSEIRVLLPSGTAVQNMRSAVGDYLTRDGHHLNLNFGRLTASLVWFKSITGADLNEFATNADLLSICASGVSELSAKGVTVTADELLSYCIAAAEAAIQNPMGVTNLK